jgi:hypothetical protein
MKTYPNCGNVLSSDDLANSVCSNCLASYCDSDYRNYLKYQDYLANQDAYWGDEDYY